jgi:hypothetical protein
MITLWDVIVVASIAGFAYWGWLVGLQVASVAALELTACLALAVLLHESLAGMLQAGFALVLGDWVGSAWSLALAFLVLAWGSFALIRFTLHPRVTDDDDEDGEAEIDPLSDRLGGAVAGGVGGAIFTGGVLVTLSIVPLLAGLKPGGDRLLLDVGKLVLRVGGQFMTERTEGLPLPLWGEPPSKSSVLSARLTSEPWFDADDDGRFTEVDRFRDVDGNGTFTKDLYFTDVDADGLRRVGLVDKYVVGCWADGLISDDRPRPEPQKPAAAPVQPPPEKPIASGKPRSDAPAAPPAAPATPKAPTAPAKDPGKENGEVEDKTKAEAKDKGTPRPKPAESAPERPGDKQPSDDF